MKNIIKRNTIFIGNIRYDITVSSEESVSFGDTVHRKVYFKYEVRRAVSRRISASAFAGNGEYAGSGVLFPSASVAMAKAVEAAGRFHRERWSPRPTSAEIDGWRRALGAHIESVCPVGDGNMIANWAIRRPSPDRDWKAVVKWLDGGGHRTTFSRAVYARVFFGAEWPEEQGKLPKPQVLMEYYDSWWECSRWKGGGFAPEDVAREILGH